MIEMLTVIAVIGILAGMLLPVLGKARERAKIAKAQTAINGLATAFKAYYTEYGKWPIAYAAPAAEDFIVDHNVIALLSGQDPSSATYLLPGPNPVARIDASQGGGPPGGSTYGPSVAIVQGNPRQIVFLEFKQSDILKNASIDPNAYGAYFADPWGKPYHFRLDVTYANQIQDPLLPAVACPGNNCITAGFLIWSLGPDGYYDQGDTVVGVPPPLVVQSSALNNDNVVSW
jgi:type II secretory pathway pseudopilin PulG